VPEPAAARGRFPGDRAVASLDLEWRRRGAYRNGEACGMDLNLAPGKAWGREREGKGYQSLSSVFLSFGCSSTVDTDALTIFINFLFIYVYLKWTHKYWKPPR